MPSVTREEATLIAAAIAAVASVAKLLADVFTARTGATRAAHRAVLEPHLCKLAVSIHGAMAGTKIVHDRAKVGQEPGNAMTSARSAAADLKSHRLEVKYSLPGLEDPLGTITRAPDWIAHYKDGSGDALLKSLQQLGRLVDATITRSYQRGRPPTRVEQWRLQRANARARGAWSRRPRRGEDSDAT